MKKISIEELLSWAFLEELPKLGGPNARFKPTYSYLPSNGEQLDKYSEMGTLIDEGTNIYGLVPTSVFEGDPHPDAIKVGDAVRGLAYVPGVDIQEGWQPFPGWNDPHGLVAAEVERIRKQEIGRASGDRRSVVKLVMSAAILRRGPDWQAEQPIFLPVTRYGNPSWFVKLTVKNSLGMTQVIEDEGFDQRKRRPKKNAYNKFKLEASLDAAIIGRLEWQVWQSALKTLAESLSGRLASHEIRTFDPDWQPWTRQKKPHSLEIA